ncbi:hypothetical protein CEXT_147331 [Caerostris extrusa]|uniref:Uncharacterized protein n=1 Tax=Caerostris extrusa TaxID=172846 RepID=A0AAV4M665_CAEEX|nr:hypothetical protein CEXT_147331 [Caerostris extrusa]
MHKIGYRGIRGRYLGAGSIPVIKPHGPRQPKHPGTFCRNFSHASWLNNTNGKEICNLSQCRTRKLNPKISLNKFREPQISSAATE